MGVTQASTLNDDTQGIRTHGFYGNQGDGTTDWYQWIRKRDGADVTMGAKADAAVSGGATTGSVIALLKGLQLALGVSTDATAPTGDAKAIGLLKSIRDTLRTGIPTDAVYKATSATAAAAACNAAIAAVAAKTNYITGITVTGAGATAGSVIVVTLVGVIGGPLSYDLTIPAGVAVGITPLDIRFMPAIPASAVNTAVTLTVPTFGAGNTNAASVIVGYQL